MSDYFDSIKKQALLAVIEPDHDAWFRYVCRWYSKEFSTPLHVVVEELEKEWILQQYYEHIYTEMDAEDRHNQAIYLLETPEERNEREQKEKDEEESLLKLAEEEAKSQNEEEVKKQALKLKNTKSLKTESPLEEIKINFVDEAVFEELLESTNAPIKKPKG